MARGLMPACPRCGRKGITLKVRTCPSCDRKGCEECMMLIGRVPRNNNWQVLVCNRVCFTKWAHKIVSQGFELSESDEPASIAGVVLIPELLGNVRTMSAEHQRRMALIEAEKMVDAARHEDAARVYETLGMYKKAGDTRRLGQRQVVTHVHVNLNDLMQQLRAMGVSASYTCPVCRSPSVITGATSSDALAKCQYCGAVTRPTDIVEAISKVIGPR